MGVAILSFSLRMYPSVQRAHSAAQILLKGVSKQAAKERKGGTQGRSRPAEGGGDYDKREHPHTCRLAHPRAFGMDGLELSGLTMTAWRWAAEYADRLVSDFHLACAPVYGGYAPPVSTGKMPCSPRRTNLESRISTVAAGESTQLSLAPEDPCPGTVRALWSTGPLLYSTRRVDTVCR